MRVTTQITFDTEVAEGGQPHVEGCYRRSGEDWHVFYFMSRDQLIINKSFVKKTLADVLAVTDWLEVRGPDSLKLK